MNANQPVYLEDEYELPQGLLRITAVDARGRVLWVREVGENLIVTTGRQMMSKLLGGVPAATTIDVPAGPGSPTPRTVAIASVLDATVYNMLWGSGGHNPVTSLALPVSPSDVAMYVPVVGVTYKAVLVSYPGGASGKSIEFRGEVGLAECVGETFSEEGLFSRSPGYILFARKTFAPFVKGNYTLYFDHRVIF